MRWRSSRRSRRGGEAGFNEAGGERIELALHLGPARFDLPLDLGEGAAADASVEEVAGLDQRRRRQPGRQVEEAVLDRAVLRHQHHEGAGRIEAHELHVLQARVLLARDDDAGAARQAGQERGSLRQRRLEGVAGGGGPDLCLDALALVDGEIADLEERVDEEAQADLRRQAPGAGMGRVDQPGMLQIRHDVAHGGGRQGHRQDAGDVARPDRLAGRQIALDDAPEDLARALVQLREGAGLIGRTGFLGRPVHRWNVIGRYSWTRSGRNSGMRPHYVSGPGPRRKPSLAASEGND